jgi:SAM-dependent methyltransferase
MRQLSPGEPWADAVLRASAILYDAGATAVWLFGSRAREKPVDRRSDYDLAVEGLKAGSIALDRATHELRGRVDIVPMEAANATLRWGIVRSRIFVPRVSGAVQPAPGIRLPDNLAGMRIRAAAERIRGVSPKSFIDFGCGRGWLLAELAAETSFDRLTGVDFDGDALSAARIRLSRALGPNQENRIDLRESLITYRDPAFLGHEAAAAVEVIEHLERRQLDAFVAVVFAFVRPRRVVITTPNVEYNGVWFFQNRSRRRHPDHRFEWSRAEFAGWAHRIGEERSYTISIEAIGSAHPDWGPPTQMAVFDRNC